MLAVSRKQGGADKTMTHNTAGGTAGMKSLSTPGAGEALARRPAGMLPDWEVTAPLDWGAFEAF